MGRLTGADLNAGRLPRRWQAVRSRELHLSRDGKNRGEAAAVFSNDTDLTEPIRMAAVERAKPVFAVCPGRWPMADSLYKVATHQRYIRKAMLLASQFPDPIPGTTIRTPKTCAHKCDWWQRR
jgi:hypothetical protein